VRSLGDGLDEEEGQAGRAESFVVGVGVHFRWQRRRSFKERAFRFIVVARGMRWDCQDDDDVQQLQDARPDVLADEELKARMASKTKGKRRFGGNTFRVLVFSFLHLLLSSHAPLEGSSASFTKQSSKKKKRGTGSSQVSLSSVF
jgi:hypothetical protein